MLQQLRAKAIFEQCMWMFRKKGFVELQERGLVQKSFMHKNFDDNHMGFAFTVAEHDTLKEQSRLKVYAKLLVRPRAIKLCPLLKLRQLGEGQAIEKVPVQTLPKLTAVRVASDQDQEVTLSAMQSKPAFFSRGQGIDISRGECSNLCLVKREFRSKALETCWQKVPIRVMLRNPPAVNRAVSKKSLFVVLKFIMETLATQEHLKVKSWGMDKSCLASKDVKSEEVNDKASDMLYYIEKMKVSNLSEFITDQTDMSKEKEKLETYLEKTFKLSWLNFEDMNIFHNMRVESGDPQEPVDIDEIEAIKASSSVRKRRRDVKEESQSQREGQSIDVDQPKQTENVDLEDEVRKGDAVAAKLDMTNIDSRGQEMDEQTKSVSPRREEINANKETDDKLGDVTKIRNTGDTITNQNKDDAIPAMKDEQKETNEQ